MDQKDVFLALGVGAARDTRERPAFAVDFHEHGHWVELAGFLTKADAEDALGRAVDKGVSPAHLRVRKVHPA